MIGSVVLLASVPDAIMFDPQKFFVFFNESDPQKFILVIDKTCAKSDASRNQHHRKKISEKFGVT